MMDIVEVAGSAFSRLKDRDVSLICWPTGRGHKIILKDRKTGKEASYDVWTDELKYYSVQAARVEGIIQTLYQDILELRQCLTRSASRAAGTR